MSDTKPQRSASGSTAVSQSLPFAPHTVSSVKLVEWLHTDPALGLAEDEVRRRLDVHGPNRLKPPAKPSVLKIVVRQIGNAMSLVLSESCFRLPGLERWGKSRSRWIAEEG